MTIEDSPELDLTPRSVDETETRSRRRTVPVVVLVDEEAASAAETRPNCDGSVAAPVRRDKPAKLCADAI